MVEISMFSDLVYQKSSPSSCKHVPGVGEFLANISEVVGTFLSTKDDGIVSKK